MTYVKMSQELFTLLKENKTKGVLCQFWPEALYKEFVEYKKNKDIVDTGLIFYDNTIDNWNNTNSRCKPSAAYSFRDDIELYIEPKKEEYIILEVDHKFRLSKVKLPNGSSYYVNDFPSMKIFRGFQQEKSEPNTWLPYIDYNLGKVLKVRIIKE